MASLRVPAARTRTGKRMPGCTIEGMQVAAGYQRLGPSAAGSGILPWISLCPEYNGLQKI